MKFDSLFLNPHLQKKINEVNNSNFQATKDHLIDEMRKSKKFSNPKYYIEAQKIKNPKQLKVFFWNFILAAENLKKI
jgi:dsRNA-specific ribonuclease